MNSEQTHQLIQSVAKLEERSKMEQLSRQELHLKMDKLIAKIDDKEKSDIGEMASIKKNVFIMIGNNKVLVFIFFIIFIFSFWQEIDKIVNKQFKTTGVEDTIRTISTRGGGIIEIDTQEIDSLKTK